MIDLRCVTLPVSVCGVFAFLNGLASMDTSGSSMATRSAQPGPESTSVGAREGVDRVRGDDGAVSRPNVGAQCACRHPCAVELEPGRDESEPWCRYGSDWVRPVSPDGQVERSLRVSQREAREHVDELHRRQPARTVSSSAPNRSVSMTTASFGRPAAAAIAPRPIARSAKSLACVVIPCPVLRLAEASSSAQPGTASNANLAASVLPYPRPGQPEACARW